jgi:hypothetical protein
VSERFEKRCTLLPLLWQQNLKHYIKNAEKNHGKVKPNEMCQLIVCADGGNLFVVINTTHKHRKRYGRLCYRWQDRSQLGGEE